MGLCTGCCSGVTGSHELLGYFDFAALLLVSCIMRRNNSAADFAVRELAVPVCNLLCYSQHQSAFAAAAAAVPMSILFTLLYLDSCRAAALLPLH